MERWEAVAITRHALEVVAAADIEVRDVNVREGPSDDLDPEFTAEVDATVIVRGKALAQLLGRQQRAVQKALKALDRKKALALLGRGRGADAVMKALAKPVAKAVDWMARDDFGRSARVVTFDLAEDQTHWHAQVGPDWVSFDLEIGVHGRWAA